MTSQSSQQIKEFKQDQFEKAQLSHNKPDQIEDCHIRQHNWSKENLTLHISDKKQKVTYFKDNCDQDIILKNYSISYILSQHSIQQLKAKVKKVWDEKKKQYVKPNVKFDVIISKPVRYQWYSMKDGITAIREGRGQTNLIRFVYSWFEIYNSYMLLTMFPRTEGKIKLAFGDWLKHRKSQQ